MTKKELKAMGEDAARLHLLRALWGACRHPAAFDAFDRAKELLTEEGNKDYAAVLNKIQKAKGAVTNFEYDLLQASKAKKV